VRRHQFGAEADPPGAKPLGVRPQHRFQRVLGAKVRARRAVPARLPGRVATEVFAGQGFPDENRQAVLTGYPSRFHFFRDSPLTE
jgi:hypothetical protein